MSIDKISIPAFLYRNMFGNNLVDLKPEKAGDAVKKELTIPFLGGNEKKITFLFADPENKFLADAHLKFIHDLLMACRLTMGDIALVNFFHTNMITYRDLLAQLQPAKILIFGPPPDNLGLPFTIPFFQIQNFGEQVYLFSPSIEDLQRNTELKKQLWACLQKIFNIQKQK